MRIHVNSELNWLLRGNGVNTAFIQHVDLLRTTPGFEVGINWRGHGDLFHSHSYGLFYFLRGLRYKGRRVLTVHVIPDSAQGSIPGWKMLMPLIRWYFKKVYSFADVCVALSPRVEEAIIETGAKTRIVRIYNPVPVEFWKNTPERREKGRKMLGLGENEFVVLGVGQLEGRKGVEDFIDMAVAMPELRFVWVGGRPFGALTEGLVRINSRISHAPSNITFPGMFELDDMPYIYASADVFVFPSFQENCPMAPLEAAAAGLPVVFRDLPEYRLLYENPWLSAENMDEFVGIISRLRSDQEYYLLNKILSDKLLSQFDKGQVRKKLIGIYTELYSYHSRK
jgi:1,2-diacylglycerol-3-alpha-glucose alpha-1,2-galactosyltransferase